MYRKLFTKIIATPRYLKRLSIVWGILIWVLCLMPSNELPKTSPIPQLDKIVHFTLYLGWSVLVLLTLSLYKRRFNAAFILFLLLLCSLLIELLQFALPIGRSFSILDLLANSAGLLAGWAIFRSLK
ncbi:VanZ family protein [Mangrovibacterium marinum]|uniref:VanZ family protein n=1 Tax=Mangrovibacterium marinum TaxID=1639118 RepID=A0A2T5BYB5_9BACT|nr:VanZ family protein [Mangrovibacterium marinum]PTN07217.1 VanZ family protein [Mangrovibacterium marinum]